jgi:lipid-A-disaccharide synthase-like uncharacterized protein
MSLFANVFGPVVAWFNDRSSTEIVWIVIGLFAQMLFMMRFVVQWIASERVKRSIVPEAFWYFSLSGGALLLAYSIYRVDPVYILGQGLGLGIYVRNLQLIRSEKRTAPVGMEPT